MKKNSSAAKNTCKFCCTPVNCQTGIQCKGACKKWMHFECLKYTPGKIQDIKNGIIQINCPCPTCKTTTPREIVNSKAPVCEEPNCPSHFKTQDSKQTCPPSPPCPPNPPSPPCPPYPPKPQCFIPKPSCPPSQPSPPCPVYPPKPQCFLPKPSCPATQKSEKESDTTEPPTPPSPCSPPLRKPCQEPMPCRPPSRSKTKARPIPRADCMPKPKPKVEKSSQPCPALLKQMSERSKECASHKTMFFPEQNVPCECPGPESQEKKEESDNCFPPERLPPCEAPPPPPKRIRCPPENQPKGGRCLCCGEDELEPESEPDWECYSPKSTRSYPECCPQGPEGQKDMPCGFLGQNASDYKIFSKKDNNNDALICTLQDLCATMGELSKQVQNLMGKLVPNC